MSLEQKQMRANSARENFLLALLNKVTKEYKALRQLVSKNIQFKIIEIISLSNIPGETVFAIQPININTITHLTASEILSKNYPLNEFSDFHAEMIRQALKGQLISFLKLDETQTHFTIIAKHYDKSLQQHIFTLENKNKIRINKTAAELAENKKLLANIKIEDIYDIGYTQGTESILNERY